MTIDYVNAGAESYPSRQNGVAAMYKNCALNSRGVPTRTALAACDIACPVNQDQWSIPGFGCCCLAPTVAG